MQNFIKKLTLFGIIALSGLQTFANDGINLQEATEETTKQTEKKLAVAAIERKANTLSMARRAFIITLRDHSRIERLKNHPKFKDIPGVEEDLNQRISNHDQAFKACYQDDSCRKAMAQSLYTSSDVRFEILALTPEGRDILAELEGRMQACDENCDCQNNVKTGFDDWYASNQ